MKRLALIFFVVLLHAACTSAPQEGGQSGAQSQEEYDNFISQTEIGVVCNGRMVKRFDCERDQIVYDDNKTMFVISNGDYSQHVTLNFDGDIYLNNLLNVDCASNGISGINNGKFEVKVAKISSRDQRYWLWSSELGVGYIVDFSI